MSKFLFKISIIVLITIILIPICFAQENEKNDIEEFKQMESTELLNNLEDNIQNPEFKNIIENKLATDPDMINLINENPKYKEIWIKEYNLNIKGEISSLNIVSYNDKGEVMIEGTQGRIKFNIEKFGEEYPGAMITEEGCLEAKGFKMCNGELLFEDNSFQLKNASVSLGVGDFQLNSDKISVQNSEIQIGNEFFYGNLYISEEDSKIKIRSMNVLIIENMNTEKEVNYRLKGTIIIESENHWSVKDNSYMRIMNHDDTFDFYTTNSVDFFKNPTKEMYNSKNSINYYDGKLKVLSYDKTPGELNFKIKTGTPFEDIKIVTGPNKKVNIEYDDGAVNFQDRSYTLQGEVPPDFSFTTPIYNVFLNSYTEHYYDKNTNEIKIKEIEEGDYFKYMNTMPGYNPLTNSLELDPTDLIPGAGPIMKIFSKFDLVKNKNDIITKEELEYSIQKAKKEGLNPETSITDLFKSLDLPNDYNSRKKLFDELINNGPKYGEKQEYKGTTEQNQKFINLILNGELSISKYETNYFKNEGRTYPATPSNVLKKDVSERIQQITNNQNQEFIPYGGQCQADTCAADTRKVWQYIMHGENGITEGGFGNAWDYRYNPNFNHLWNKDDKEEKFDDYHIGDFITIKVPGSKYEEKGMETHVVIVVGINPDDPQNPKVRSVEGENNVRIKNLDETLFNNREATLVLRNKQTPDIFEELETTVDEEGYINSKKDTKNIGPVTPITPDITESEKTNNNFLLPDKQENNEITEGVLESEGEGKIAIGEKIEGKEREIAWEGIDIRYNPNWEGWDIILPVLEEYNGEFTPEAVNNINNELSQNKELNQMASDYRTERFQDSGIMKIDSTNMQNLIYNFHYIAPSITVKAIGGGDKQIKINSQTAKQITELEKYGTIEEKEKFALKFANEMFQYFDSPKRVNRDKNIDGWTNRVELVFNRYFEKIGSNIRIKPIKTTYSKQGEVKVTTQPQILG